MSVQWKNLKRVAVKWLVFRHGHTAKQASDVMDGKFCSHPYDGLRQEATDIATFIIEECHGR